MMTVTGMARLIVRTVTGQAIILMKSAVNAEEAVGIHMIRNAMHVTVRDAM